MIIIIITAIFLLRNYLLYLYHNYPFGHDCFGHLYNISMIKTYGVRETAFLNTADYFKNTFILCDNNLGRPPLYYIIIILLDIFANNIQITMLFLAPILFLLMTIYYTFKTSELIVKDSGIYSIVLLSLFPGTILISSGISLYFAQTAFISAAFYYFFKSSFLRDKKQSFIFGLFFGLGMLIKEQFFTFFIGPFLISSISMIRNKEKPYFVNIGLFLLAAVLTGGPLFAASHAGRYTGHEQFMSGINSFSSEFYKYISGFVRNISIPLSIFLFLAIIKGIRQKKILPILFISSFIGAISIFSMYRVCGDDFHWYYAAGSIPLAAMVMGIFLKTEKNISSAVLLSTLLLFYCFKAIIYLDDVNITPFRSFQTKEIIRILQENGITKNSNLKLTVFNQTDSVSGFEIPVLLMSNGYKGYVNNTEFFEFNNLMHTGEFDVMVFIRQDRSLSWPEYDVFKEKADAALKSHDIANKELIDNIYNTKANMRCIATLPYFQSKDEDPVFISVFLKDDFYSR